MDLCGTIIDFYFSSVSTIIIIVGVKEKVGIQRINVQHDRYGWWYDIIYYPLIYNIGKTLQGVIKVGKSMLSTKPYLQYMKGK